MTVAEPTGRKPVFVAKRGVGPYLQYTGASIAFREVER
jgi:hypothetical protein